MNEHWYYDCNSKYYEGTESDDAIVLEIGSEHSIDVDNGCTFVVIERGTELFNELVKAMGMDYLAKSSTSRKS